VGVVASCLSLTVLVTAVSAGETGGFMACGQVESDANRLACYDRVYTSRLQADSAEEITAQPKDDDSLASVEPAPVAEQASELAAVEQARAEAAFGFPRSTYPDEIKTLRSRVVRFEQNSRKMMLFYLENGQVWIQSESRRFLTPDEPVTAEIAPGMFGAFFLTLEGKKQRIKVKRIR